MPAEMNAGTSARYSTVGVATTASHARATAWSAMPATSSGRVAGPRRRASPAIGATKTGMIVHGSVRRPAWSGL